MSQFRGVDEAKITDQRTVINPDTRTTFQQVADIFKNYFVACYILLILAIACYVIPALCLIAPILGLIFASLPLGAPENRELPIHIPKTINCLDPHDQTPGLRRAQNRARGLFMLGNLRKTAKEIWISLQTLLTHTLMLGTTGGGKTEALVSMSGLMLSMGSGVIYADAKAAPKLLYQIATLARIFGRDDDIRVINYITGAKTVEGKDPRRLSNTTNPFSVGSGDMAVQTLVSLLPTSSGENQVFVERAIALISAAMPALVELRDKHDEPIYPSRIAEYITLAKFRELADDERLSVRARAPVKAYLNSLPGYIETKPPERQPEEVGRQFGFAQAYFTRSLASLSDTYGHVYNTPFAEIDFTDVVFNSRILIILIPSMEKAGEERRALGKVILSSLRTAMAQGLGDKIEGDREIVLDALPTASSIPSMIIVDEYAEVATEGFAVTATQGRGLGFAVVFAGQDLAGFYKASQEEAEMIFGNTRIKIALALEDPKRTWEALEAIAGEAWVQTTSGYKAGEGDLDAYRRNPETRLEKRSRIDILDLKEQEFGQAHIFYKSDILRAQMFHHGIDDDSLIADFRLNRQLRIPKPAEETVNRLKTQRKKYDELSDYVAAVETGKLAPYQPEVPSSLLSLIAALSGTNQNTALHAFAAFTNTNHVNLLEQASTALDTFNQDSEYSQTPDDGDTEEGSYSASTTNNESAATESSHNLLDDIQYADEDPENLASDSLYASLDDEENHSSLPSNAASKSSIEDVVSQAKNEWFTVSDDPTQTEDSMPMPERLFNDFVQINESMGIDEETARIESAHTIKSITEAIEYPTSPVIEPEDDDDAALLSAIEHLQNLD